MSGFRFRLEKVRDLRSAEEQEQARRLAQARSKVARARGVVDRIDRAEAGVRDRARAALRGRNPVGMVQNLEVLLNQLGRQRALAEAACASAEEALDAAVEDYQRAFREREIMDRLRERRQDEWRREELRREQGVLDELGRGGSGAGGGRGS